MTESKDEWIRIRPMTEKDISEVAALEAETFSDAWSSSLYEETLRSGRYDCRVLELCRRKEEQQEFHETETKDGAVFRIAGYFCGQIILDEAEVHRIAVRQELRGRGYGQLLLEDFLARSAEAGVMSVLLEVRAGNAPAIGLYVKNGFARVGVRRGYYQKPKEDAEILKKCF